MSAPARPDKLDRIEQSANLATIRDREVVVTAPIALALVRVARAARALFGALGYLENEKAEMPEMRALQEALVELEAQ